MGTYQICLQTTDSCGADRTSFCYNLDVCLLPSPNFVANNTTGFTFHFVPTTTNALFYLWNFGDGNFSNASSPIYTYQSKGLYTVCLNLEDDCDVGDTCIDVLASLIDLEENANSISPFIYPSPTKGIFSINGLPEYSLFLMKYSMC